MRRLAPILVFALAPLVFASVASAQQPTFEPVPIEASTWSGFCGFDVVVSPLQAQLVRKVFTDRSGEVVKEVWTGVVKVRLTNVATGKSIDANISGPEQIRIDEDGSLTDAAVGSWLIGSRRAGAIFLTHGRYVFGSGPVVESLRGTFENACVLLSDP
jgi:hypothetical protein